MLRKLAFGQYVHKDSVMHRLDARVKMISVIALSIASFLLDSYRGMIFFSLLILFFVLLSRIRFTALAKNLRPFSLMAALILVMYLIFSFEELDKGIISVWRFILLIMIASMLTFTTTISDMIAAIEKMLYPLKRIGASPRVFALLISMTIRFIPSMFLYAERTLEAQNARLGSLKKPKNIRKFMVRMLERVFQSASSVSDALLARNFTRERKHYFNDIKLRGYDYLSFFILAVSLVIVIFFR